MMKFSARFSDFQMEREYQKIVAKTHLSFIQAATLFWIVSLAAFSVSLFLENNQTLGIVTISLSCGMILLLLLNPKLKNFSNYLIGILSTVYGIGGLFIIIHTTKNDTSNFSSFFQGWSFSCVQIILITLAQQLKYKFAIMLLSLIARFAIVGSKHTGVFNVYNIVGNILFEITAIYIVIILRNREKTIFESFFRFRQEHLTLKVLLDNCMPQSITVFNSAGTDAIFSNKASYAIFSRSQNTAPFLPPLDSMKVEIEKNKEVGSLQQASSTAPEGMATLQDYLKELFRVNLSGNMIALPVSCTINNERRLFEAKITSIVWEKSNAYALILNDITHQDEISALKTANEYKDLLVATVSHELRTPLNGITGILDLAIAKNNESALKEDLLLCKDNTELLLSLVNSMLDLQQIRHGKLSLNPTLVDLHSLMSNTLRLFSFSSNQKGLYLKLEISDKTPTFIFTDGNRLKQILINLIGNALKFTSQGGITIKVSDDAYNPKLIKFTVCDTGVGIKDEQKRRLFRRFSKLDDPKGLNRQGAGLGLSIAESLAKLLREDDIGKGIYVESIYGKGSSFSFTILASLSQDQDKEEPQQKEEISPGLDSQKGLLLLEHVRSDNESLEIEVKDYNELIKPLDVEVKMAHYSDRVKLNMSNLDSSLKMSKCASRENLFLEETTRNVDTLGSPVVHIGRTKTPSHFRTSLLRNRYLSESPIKLARESILIVDDNVFNIYIAKNVVEVLGYSAETAIDGERAIQKVKSLCEAGHPPKLILMDCQMPIMDGYEVTKALKEMMKKNEIHNIPIVALSANDKEFNLHGYKECGMADFLPKPLVKEDLARIISNLSN